MSESYLLREQELLRLNHELDLKNKTVQQNRVGGVVNTNKQRATQQTGIRSGILFGKEKEKERRGNKENTESKKLSSNRRYVDAVNTFVETELDEKEVPAEVLESCSSPRKQSTKPQITTRSQKPRPSGVMATNPIPDKLAKKNISTEGLIRFLKAKVTVLQEELESILDEGKKRTDDLQTSLELQHQMEIQRDQTIVKNNSLQATIIKLEERMSDVEKKLKDRESEVVSLRKEGDLTKRELKNVNQSNTTLERRLIKTQEDLENTKNNLNSSQQMERVMSMSTDQKKNLKF